MIKQELLNKLNYDIETGVYDRFPKVKSKIQYISNKIARLIYISNAEELSSGEISILINNGYVAGEFYYNPSKLFS